MYAYARADKTGCWREPLGETGSHVLIYIKLRGYGMIVYIMEDYSVQGVM